MDTEKMLLTFCRKLFLLCLLASFSAIAEDYSRPPQADLSTPENALYSYWAIQDWSNQFKTDLLENNRDISVTFGERAFPKAMADITTGEVNKYWMAFKFQPPSKIARTIIKTSADSENRVEIIANFKNITPIPADIEPTAEQLNKRRIGANNRYLIERVGNVWKVAEVWFLGEPGSRIPPYKIYKNRGPSFPCCVLLEH